MTAFFYGELLALGLLALVGVTAAMERTAIGRRIADGLLASLFPPRDAE